MEPPTRNPPPKIQTMTGRFEDTRQQSIKANLHINASDKRDATVDGPVTILLIDHAPWPLGLGAWLAKWLAYMSCNLGPRV